MKPLLGLPDSIALGCIQLGPDVQMLQKQAPEFQEYSDLFNIEDIGKLQVVCHIKLDEFVIATVCAPRKVPVAMKEKVFKGLDRMLGLGVAAVKKKTTARAG